jgi:hypothetical protein
MTTRPDSRQIKKRSALNKLGVPADGSVELALDQLNVHADYPLRMSASDVADSRLNFSSSVIDSADSTKTIAPPVNGELAAQISSAYIDFQDQSLSNVADFEIEWPSSNTVGYFRNAGFVLNNLGKIEVIFSDEEATEGALLNPGELFDQQGILLGYIVLECTDIAGYFKTAGSLTDIIENTKIYRFGGRESFEERALQGQFVEHNPTIDPSITTNAVVYWNELNARYEGALSGDPVASLVQGYYIYNRDVIITDGLAPFNHSSDPFTTVYLSDVVPGQVTFAPSQVIIGHTHANNKLHINIEFNEEVTSEPGSLDGNQSVQLKPQISFELVLEDTNNIKWKAVVDNDGNLSSEITTDEVSGEFKITKNDLSFAEIKVDTDGVFYVVSPPTNPSAPINDYYYILSPDETHWKFSINLSDQIVMDTFDNRFSVVADNGKTVFETQQTDQYKAVQGVSIYTTDDLPANPTFVTDTAKWAFLNLGFDIIVPIYWDGYRWQRFNGGSIGDYKHSMLPETQFQLVNGDGWVQAKGQDITGSKFAQFTGITRLPRALGAAIRSVVDIADKQFSPSDVDISTESIYIPDGHEYETGDKVIVLTTTTLPAPLVGFPDTTISIAYYVIKIDSYNIKLATTISNAYLDIAINITSQGAGIHTLQQSLDASPRINRENGGISNTSGTFQEDSIEYHTHADTAVRIYQDGIIDAVSLYANVNDADYSQTRLSSNGNIGKRSNETRMMNVSGYLYIKIN